MKDIKNMTVSEILYNNYQQLKNCTKPVDDIMNIYDIYDMVLSDMRETYDIPEQYNLPRCAIIALILESTKSIKHKIPSEYLTKHIVKSMFHQFCYYNWGKTKTVFDISDKTMKKIKEQYTNKAFKFLQYSPQLIIDHYPNGAYIKGNINKTKNITGSFVGFDYMFNMDDPNDTTNREDVLTMNAVDKLILENDGISDDSINLIIRKVYTPSDYYLIENKTINETIELTTKSIRVGNGIISDDQTADTIQRDILRCIFYIVDCLGGYKEGANVGNITIDKDSNGVTIYHL